MIALGRLLKLAGIDYDEEAIRGSLPRRYQDENVAAIRFGYDLTDAEIARLAAAAPPSRFEMNEAATAEVLPMTKQRSGGRNLDGGLRQPDEGSRWPASARSSSRRSPDHRDDQVEHARRSCIAAT